MQNDLLNKHSQSQRYVVGKQVRKKEGVCSGMSRYIWQTCSTFTVSDHACMDIVDFHMAKLCSKAPTWESRFRIESMSFDLSPIFLMTNIYH